MPEACLYLGLEPVPAMSEERPESAEARWNRLYREGIRAIDERDLELAHESFCAALAEAHDFGPRDFRFAETLDELGLVAFLSADLERAEAMQGAAVAEMLLALGPEDGGTARLPGGGSRMSSVAIYARRLRLIYETQGLTEPAGDPAREPYRIFERGYLPLDGALARRLDWLISQYLLAESFAAADWLSDLRVEIEPVER